MLSLVASKAPQKQGMFFLTSGRSEGPITNFTGCKLQYLAEPHNRHIVETAHRSSHGQGLQIWQMALIAEAPGMDQLPRSAHNKKGEKKNQA